MGDSKPFYRTFLTSDVFQKCVHLNRGKMLSVVTTHKYKDAEFQVLVQFWCLNDGFIHMQISEADNGQLASEVPHLIDENKPIELTSEKLDISNIDPYNLRDSKLNCEDTVEKENKVFCKITNLKSTKSGRRKNDKKIEERTLSEQSVALDLLGLEDKIIGLANTIKHEPDIHNEYKQIGDIHKNTEQVSQFSNNVLNIEHQSKRLSNQLECNTESDTFNNSLTDTKTDYYNTAEHNSDTTSPIHHIDSDVTDIYSEHELSGKNQEPNGDEGNFGEKEVKIHKKRGRKKKLKDKASSSEPKNKKLVKQKQSKDKKICTKPRKAKQVKLEETESKKVVKCLYCDFLTTAPQYLGRHIRCKHPEIKDFPAGEFGGSTSPANCKFCHKQMLHDHSLYRHVMIRHKMEPGYDEEINRLEKSRRCKCPYCPTTVTRPAHLQRHINDVHECDESRGKRCELCGLVLKNEACYQNHIRYTHKTEKKCLCTICGNMYKSVGHLNEHLKNVHGNEKFPCDLEGCDFVGNSAKYLKKHKKYKHGSATFMCDICARKFKCMQRLKLHYQLIHKLGSLEQHTCSDCGKKFNLKSNMKKHIDGVHKKTWKFKCMFCEKGFFSSKLLEIHISRHHNVTEDNLTEDSTHKKTNALEEKNILDFSGNNTSDNNTNIDHNTIVVLPRPETNVEQSTIMETLQPVPIIDSYRNPSERFEGSKSLTQLHHTQHEAENLTSSWNSELMRDYSFNGADYSAAVQTSLITNQQHHQQQQEGLDCSVKNPVAPSAWQGCSPGTDRNILGHMKY